MSGDASEIRVRVDTEAGRTVIQPVGACRAGVCPSLRAYLDWAQPPAIREVYFDLSETEFVDSTFIGLLLSTVRPPSGGDRPMHLVGPSGEICKLLHLMHLESVFHIIDALPPAEGAWQTLSTQCEDTDALADLIIDAHQALIDADARNEPAFRRVVDGFRAKREGGDA